MKLLHDVFINFLERLVYLIPKFYVILKKVLDNLQELLVSCL